MGAAPSRETHRRGLFSLHPPGNSNTPAAGGGSSGSGKKQDIVLIPLTKEFFPSPDCPLFVQFHRARCDAAVNYYFRRPGNPGDLSAIPNYASSYRLPGEVAIERQQRRQRKKEQLTTGAAADDEVRDGGDDDDDVEEAAVEDDSYPSREALYHGVIERMEETLFDTDEEMRRACEWAAAHPHTTMGPDGRKQKKVLPVLCAVAFRYDPNKIGLSSATAAANLGGSSNGTAASQTNTSPLAGQGSGAHQAAVENGVYMYGSILNIVGCFGFVSMQEDVDDAKRETQQQQKATGSTLLTPASVLSLGGNTAPGMSRSSPSPSGTFHHDPYSFTSSAGSSDASLNASGTLLVSTRSSKGRRLTCIANSQDLMALPPPVAAPLAAMVFLTKSAGEQNLGRVTYIAASTYYFQMIQAGVIERQESMPVDELSPYPRPPTTSSASPPSPSPIRPMLPPMETFSFSSLLTNIPILSFLYEMKWRWGYLGVLKNGTPAGHLGSRNDSFAGAATARGPGSMMGNHSSGGLAGVDRSVGQDVTDEMEMWITADQMIHGRISKHLAQRLCWSLAERPEVMQERVAQLPSEEDGYWRYRGLVDKARPPPLPEPGKVVEIHPKDVYVMGSDVLPGFNEGDILHFDTDRLVWFADHSIPLEGLVLAAMRPYCKQAREASSDDPRWETRVVHRDEVEDMGGLPQEEQYPLPPMTPEQAAAVAKDLSLVCVHEHVGSFYVYRFERDGVVYYHGTVPNFANPNKKRSAAIAAAGGPAGNGVTPTAGGSTPTPLMSSLVMGQQPAAGAGSTSTATAAATTLEPCITSPKQPPSKMVVPVPKTIASALFSLLPASSTTGGQSTRGSTAAAATTSTGGSAASAPPLGSAATAVSPSHTKYLATPVTSTPSPSHALSTAQRWMRTLYTYAYGAPNAAQGSSKQSSSRPPLPMTNNASGTASIAAAGLNGGHGGGIGSYPSTPLSRHSSGHCGATLSSPTAFNSGFPSTRESDVATWPATYSMSGPGTRGAATTTPATASSATHPVSGGTYGPPATPGAAARPLAGRGVVPPADAPENAGPPSAAAVQYASRPLRRYTEGGKYEWDWRK